MANLEGGNFDKFTVIKNEDLKYINSCFKFAMLKNDLEDIQAGRARDGKKTDNKYIVINTDEPYVDEVIEILKRNGHWG